MDLRSIVNSGWARRITLSCAAYFTLSCTAHAQDDSIWEIVSWLKSNQTRADYPQVNKASNVFHIGRYQKDILKDGKEYTLEYKIEFRKIDNTQELNGSTQRFNVLLNDEVFCSYTLDKPEESGPGCIELIRELYAEAREK